MGPMKSRRMNPSPGRATAPAFVAAKILCCSAQFKPSFVGVLDSRVHMNFATLGALKEMPAAGLVSAKQPSETRFYRSVLDARRGEVNRAEGEDRISAAAASRDAGSLL